jgi:hypothetical protein
MEKREEVLRVLRVSAIEREEIDAALWGSDDESIGNVLSEVARRCEPGLYPESPTGVYSRG